MVINAIFPPLEAALLFFISFALRSYDQGLCCRKVRAESTKKKTLFAFINLYSGDEFEIYYQYFQNSWAAPSTLYVFKNWLYLRCVWMSW